MLKKYIYSIIFFALAITAEAPHVSKESSVGELLSLLWDRHEQGDPSLVLKSVPAFRQSKLVWFDVAYEENPLRRLYNRIRKKIDPSYMTSQDIARNRIALLQKRFQCSATDGSIFVSPTCMAYIISAYGEEKPEPDIFLWGIKDPLNKWEYPKEFLLDYRELVQKSQNLFPQAYQSIPH